MDQLPDPDLASSDLKGRPFQIKSAHLGDSVVIPVSGELDLKSASVVDAAIRDAERTDAGWIVVDLGEVSFVDSTGLSALLLGKNRSGDRLSCIPSRHEHVARLLELTGATEILDSG